MFPHVRLAATLLLAATLAVFGSAAQAEALRIGLSSEPTSLDPQFARNGNNQTVAAHMFSRLAAPDENNQLQPDLATRWRNVDPLTWEVTIRKGVRFHDGSPLTLDDIVFSLERVKTITTSPAPFTENVAAIESVTPSDQPDTDVTIKLVDVYPPSEGYPLGYAHNLTDGILRCRYRNSFECPEPLASGEVAAIRVEAFATCNLFKAGHRIRLDVSSSNFPKFDVNPNSFEPEGFAERPRRAVNRVHLDQAHPSRVILPVAPV